MSKSIESAGRPRILLVGPFPPTKGGVTTFMLNLMESSAKKGFTFVPFTTSRPPKKNVTNNWGYGSVLRGGIGRVLSGLAITAWHLVKFPFVVTGSAIDLVQIQASDYQVFWEASLYTWMARALRRPVVFRIGGAFDIFHGGSSPRLQRLIARTLHVPDCVIVQSNFARDYVGAMNAARRMIVLSNWSRGGVGAPRPISPAGQAPLFLFIAGNEAERKGVRLVLEAARTLEQSGSPARFHLIAVPDMLAAEIGAMGLHNIVRVDGPLDREQVLEAMARAGVFLLPSYGEGFPNSLIEAMAAGMASIVCPVGGVPEIVAEGGALTVPVGSAAALTNAIRELAESPQMRDGLGRAAQRTIAQRYTPEAALSPLIGVYRDLLEVRA